jgi:uncharacterized protein YecE (DUF72 family)
VQHVIITQLLASCRRACHASAKKLQQFWSSLTPLPSALRNFGAILIQLPVKKLRSTKSLHMHTSFNERIKKKIFTAIEARRTCSKEHWWCMFWFTGPHES